MRHIYIRNISGDRNFGSSKHWDFCFKKPTFQTATKIRVLFTVHVLFEKLFEKSIKLIINFHNSFRNSQIS